MNLLSVSDVEISFLYSPQIRERFAGVDLILSCGDLSYYYLEYILNVLDRPLFYVRGNHHNTVESGSGGDRTAPQGGIDLHRRTVNYEGLLLAGIEGSLRYNYGPGQYSQAQMWMHVWRLVPALQLNKLRYGRYLDLFITHAPPSGIQDMSDLPHHGIKAFRWLDRVFKPTIHFHGHTHIYRTNEPAKTCYCDTWVINTYGYRQTEIEPGKHLENLSANEREYSRK